MLWPALNMEEAGVYIQGDVNMAKDGVHINGNG